jgi:hypothetical protein
MAINDIYLFTTGYTSADVGSLKPNYPLKKRYRQITNTSSPLFPEAYELVSDQEYWFPFENITVNDDSYVEYEFGDEFTFTEVAPVRSISSSAPATNTKKYVDYPAGFKILYANELYEATDFYFNWSDTGFDVNSNPYMTNTVRKWRIFNSSPNTWVSFWYEPRVGRFYPLPDTEQTQSVSSLDNQITDRWQLFTGDSSGMDLSTFSSKKIDELVSRGFSVQEATSAVTSEEQAAITSVYGATQVSQVALMGSVPTTPKTNTGLVDNGFAKPTTTAVVSLSSAGAEGEGGAGSSDRPQMIQYYKNPDGSSATVPERFEFDYRPNSVNYSNIGSEWTEIGRVNNSPLLDFRSFKLMKISFEFLVGDNNNIFTSCDDELRTLRAMAIRPFPVTFLGFDAMFNEQLIYPLFSGGSGIEFAIVDMSIVSVQRARADAGSFGQTPTGAINRATVNLTIQELPLEMQTLIQLPKLIATGKELPKRNSIPASKCRARFDQTPEYQSIFPSAGYDDFQKDFCKKQ